MPVGQGRARLGLGTALVLSFAVCVAGCSFLSGTDRSVSALRGAGYRNVGIHFESGSGLPSDGLVDVSYSTGPTGNTEGDAYNAARIVWNTLPYRMGALVITRTSGSCTAGFCVSHSSDLRGESYAQMRDQFGPRPAGLDRTPASHAVRVPLWLPIVIGAVVLVGATAIVVAIIRTRSRPERGPWTPPTSGGNRAPPSPQ